MRDPTPYAARREWKAPEGYGISAAEPAAGFYWIKLGSGTVACGVQIVFGPPLDPVTGETLDRSWRWMAYLDDGSLADLDRVWPACARHPITEDEFKARQGRRRWARENAPDSAYADRTRKIDRLSRSEVLPF